MALADHQAAAAADLARAGEANAPVQIIDYDPAWPVSFQAERKRLTPLLGGADIHHIGSTAVPGLAAKPVIDMMALVPDIDAPIAALVERAGYQFPPRITRRSRTVAGSATRRPHTAPTTCILSMSSTSSTVTCASATGCAQTPRSRVNTPHSSADFAGRFASRARTCFFSGLDN
jgi:GrpB-like predicted nucleotidyltransferase (UPF0157 family)